LLARSGARAWLAHAALYQFYPQLNAAILALLGDAPAGTYSYPDESATLIIGCALGTGRRLRLRGPGIATVTELWIVGHCASRFAASRWAGIRCWSPLIACWAYRAQPRSRWADGLCCGAWRRAGRTINLPDVTRGPLRFPAPRAHRLQSLARADTGLGYASMRGYGLTHPTVNQVRLGYADVQLRHPISGAIFSAGRMRVSQAEIVSNSADKLDHGFAATMGWNEIKTISVACGLA